jgi:hypothetical protein
MKLGMQLIHRPEHGDYAVVHLTDAGLEVIHVIHSSEVPQ